MGQRHCNSSMIGTWASCWAMCRISGVSRVSPKNWWSVGVEFQSEGLGISVALFGWKGIPGDVLDDFQFVDFEGLGLEALAVFEDKDGWCAEGWGVGFSGTGIQGRQFRRPC